MRLFNYKIGKIIGLIGLICLSVLLTSCGGGGGSSGGFGGGADTLRIEIVVDKPTLQVNTIAAFPDDATVFTTNIIVRVFDQENRLFQGGTISLDIDTGLDSGALLYTTLGPASDEDAETDQDGNIIPAFFRRLVFENSTGIEQALLHSSRRAGVIALVATIVDPGSGDAISIRAEVTVVEDPSPNEPFSITFTGPFIDAVRAGEAFFQGTGTLTRNIAVIVNDANGQPVTPDTQIDFFMIDSPIIDYPGNGAGSFFIAGNDGDPVEGGLLFGADSGNFISRGLRPFDRLVLDGTLVNLPDNRDLTGVRVVGSVVSNTLLNVTEPFNLNGVGNNGATVPYIAGRALHGTVLSKGFTDLVGVARTVLTYPAQRLNQTAILVACTTDKSVCDVFNTCNANGTNCDPVYLPVAAGLQLTTSATTVDANSLANVELCVRNSVDGIGVPGAAIDYTIRGNQGNAMVTVDGDAALSNSVITEPDGCVTVAIESTGVVPNSDNLTIEFMADGVDGLVVITITPPNSLELLATATCDIPDEMNDPICGDPLACSVDLLVVDDIGNAVPGVVITVTDSTGILDLTFNPAFTDSTGSTAGMTDNTGQNFSTFTVFGADTIIQVPNPNFDPNQPPDPVTNPQTIDATQTTYTGSITYDLVGGGSSTFDFDVNGLVCIQPF